MATPQYSPQRQPIPPEAVLCAMTRAEYRLQLPGPSMELALYRLPDEAYLVEWFWVKEQDETPAETRHEVAECDTFLIALHRLATFALQEWDTRPEALEQYGAAVEYLLEDFFVEA